MKRLSYLIYRLTFGVVLALLMAAWLCFLATISRNCKPYSRNFEATSARAFEVLSLANVSGITSAGTSPYFSVRSATPQNVPPSPMGDLKKNCTLGSSMGLLAVSITPCSIRFAFSN